MSTKSANKPSRRIAGRVDQCSSESNAVSSEKIAVGKKNSWPKLKWTSFDSPYTRVCRSIVWILDDKRKKQESEDLCYTIDGFLIRKIAEVNHGNLETFVKRHDRNGIKVDRSPFTNRINFIIITKEFEVYLRNTFIPVEEA